MVVKLLAKGRVETYRTVNLSDLGKDFFFIFKTMVKIVGKRCVKNIAARYFDFVFEWITSFNKKHLTNTFECFFYFLQFLMI